MSKRERVERVISERVVGERVLGSANPAARAFRGAKSGIAGAIRGVFTGIVLFLLAVYVSTCDVERHSKEVAKLTPVAATDAAGLSGLQIVTGEPQVIARLDAPNVDEAVLFYTWEKQEYVTEIVKENVTKTVTEGGVDKEVTIEQEKEVSDWKTIEEKTGAASFKLGGLTVNPEHAKLDIPGFKREIDAGKSAAGNDLREITSYYKVPSSVTVVGEISGGEISGGKVFRISQKAPEEVVDKMRTEETQQFFGLKAIAALLFFISFSMILGPVLLLTKIIPVAGGLARGVIYAISLVISVVLVAVITIVVKFWWAIAAAMLAGGIIAIFAAMNRSKKPQVQA